MNLGLPCWEQDSNLGPLGLAPSALTALPHCLLNEVLILCRNATSHLLFLSQSVLADFDHRKKTPCLSGTRKKIINPYLSFLKWIVFSIIRWAMSVGFRRILKIACFAAGSNYQTTCCQIQLSTYTPLHGFSNGLYRFWIKGCWSKKCHMCTQTWHDGVFPLNCRCKALQVARISFDDF